MASAKLFAATGDFKNDIQLPALFDQEVNKVCMYLHIKAILNNNRQGTAQTKSKGEVSRRLEQEAVEAEGYRPRSCWSEHLCSLGSWC